MQLQALSARAAGTFRCGPTGEWVDAGGGTEVPICLPGRSFTSLSGKSSVPLPVCGYCGHLPIQVFNPPLFGDK